MSQAKEISISDNKISLSCVFDFSYLEAALVTFSSAEEFHESFDRLYLVFLLPDDPNSNEALIGKEILRLYMKSSPFGDKLKVLLSTNFLPKFEIYHFSNAIFYKGLIPTFLPNTKYVLNIDAGSILGMGILPFLQVLNKYCSSHDDWCLGAFLHNASENLSQDLSQKASRYYPNGQLMLFNVHRYLSNKVSERFIQGLTIYFSLLKMGEQELFSLILRDDEFFDFPMKEKIYLDDLASIVYSKPNALDSKLLNECIYYKNTGAFKPWKIWNLNPNKHIYLKHRAKIDWLFLGHGRDLFEKNRRSTRNAQYLEANYLAYEKLLLSNFTSLATSR